MTKENAIKFICERNDEEKINPYHELFRIKTKATTIKGIFKAVNKETDNYFKNEEELINNYRNGFILSTKENIIVLYD